MGKSKSDKANAKEDRKAKKAELNREREQGRRRRNVQLDSSEVASFAKVLLAEGLELKEVDRDGNCFFRSLCDQVEGHEHDQQVCQQAGSRPTARGAPVLCADRRDDDALPL